MDPDFLTYLKTYGQNPDPTGMGAPQPDQNPNMTASTGNIANQIQLALGAKQPDQGGQVQDILSARFAPSSQDMSQGPSLGNYVQSAISSLHGNYTPAQDIASQDMMTKIKAQSELERAQYLSQGGGGNATLKATQQLMANDPNLDFATAFSIAKSGAGQGNTVVNGQVQNIGGAPQAGGNLEYAKKAGDQKAILENASPIASATETGKEQGLVQTQAQANLPLIIDQAQNTLDTLDKAIKHPGLDANFGLSGKIPNVPGSSAADAATFLDQIRGTSFLTAFNQLRGGGSISNVEGAKAETAYARMQSAQSANAFRDAANDYKNIVEKAVVRARNTASGAVFTQPPAAIGTPSSIAPSSNVVDYTEYFK